METLSLQKYSIEDLRTASFYGILLLQ